MIIKQNSKCTKMQKQNFLFQKLGIKNFQIKHQKLLYTTFTFMVIYSLISPAILLLFEDPLLENYYSVGQKLPIPLAEMKFRKWPKCNKFKHSKMKRSEFDNSTFKLTYYMKSHYLEGQKRRNWVRKSWGLDKDLVFVTFGGEKGNENHPHDFNSTDMLVIDGITEIRSLLSLKITLALYHANSCQKFKPHILITDDDVFFWSDDLESKINKIWDGDTIEARGHVRFNDNIVRPKSSVSNAVQRYEISREMFSPDKVPPYFIGAGYVVSSSAVSKIAKHLSKTGLLWQVDDAYFGFLMHDSGIPLKNDVRFTSYEEHQFVQTSKSLIRFNFNQHWYRCDLHNFHGILVDDEFLRIKDSQCGKDDQKKFKMKPEVLEKFRIDF